MKFYAVYKKISDLDMFHDSLKLDWFILPLHGRRIQPVPSVFELNYEAFRVSHGQVVLRAEVFKRLHKTTNKILAKSQKMYEIIITLM
jgi:hypothetical protein